MPVYNVRAFPDAPDPLPDDLFESSVMSLRRRALSDSDWRALPDAPGDQSAWLTYRADLRDGPAILATRNGDFVTLPDPPEAG